MKEKPITIMSEVGIQKLTRLHETSYYMKVLPGGHCLLCHFEYVDTHDYFRCAAEHPGGATACLPICQQSRFYTPNLPDWTHKKYEAKD